MLLGYVFRREETPIIRETPGAATLDIDTLSERPTPPEREALHADDAHPADEPSETPSAVVDDAALFGSLQARMQALASERAAEDEKGGDDDESATAPPPVEDSTDGWGSGSTAVLERPPADDEPCDDAQRDDERGVFDGEPSVEFPPGFPLVEGKVVEVDTTPAASEDQIAMLNRMMGKAE